MVGTGSTIMFFSFVFVVVVVIGFLFVCFVLVFPQFKSAASDKPFHN